MVHDVVHHIVISNPPLASRIRRLHGDKLEAARQEFLSMEKEGIIRRSTSPWASPLHMVQKKDGTWPPCGDFRRLSLVTEPDRYSLPNMLDFSESQSSPMDVPSFPRLICARGRCWSTRLTSRRWLSSCPVDFLCSSSCHPPVLRGEGCPA
jgi:hypothetical protein